MNIFDWTPEQWRFFFVFTSVLLFIQGYRSYRQQKEEEGRVHKSQSAIVDAKPLKTKKVKRMPKPLVKPIETKQKLYVLKSEQQQKQSNQNFPSKKKKKADHQKQQINKITKSTTVLREDKLKALNLNEITISIVGGNEKYFKETVEELGGALIHHTGNGGYDVPRTLNNIDLVCFYIEQCSHGAVEKVKEMCKKEGIPFCFIRGGRHGLKRTIVKNFHRIKK